jgi:hypothetical protein
MRRASDCASGVGDSNASGRTPLSRGAIRGLNASLQRRYSDWGAGQALDSWLRPGYPHFVMGRGDFEPEASAFMPCVKSKFL